MGILVKSSIDSRQFVLDYQTFLNKSNSNKTYYNSLVKSGQLKPEQYTSITIERIDTYGVNVSAFAKCNTTEISSSLALWSIISMVISSSVCHVTNPSKMKEWFEKYDPHCGWSAVIYSNFDYSSYGRVL